jgi:hypothetical protein
MECYVLSVANELIEFRSILLKCYSLIIVTKTRRNTTYMVCRAELIQKWLTKNYIPYPFTENLIKRMFL